MGEKMAIFIQIIVIYAEKDANSYSLQANSIFSAENWPKSAKKLSQNRPQVPVQN
jgi:hypothetical protein